MYVVINLGALLGPREWEEGLAEVNEDALGSVKRCVSPWQQRMQPIVQMQHCQLIHVVTLISTRKFILDVQNAADY